MKQVSLMCVLLALLLVGLPSLGEASLQSSAQAPLPVTSSSLAGFSDDFGDPILKPGWTWVDPLGDSSYSLTDNPGHLRLYTPDGGHDLYLNLNAPRMVQGVAGDFVARAKVTIDPQYTYQGAGLLIWQDSNNYIRIERNPAGIQFAYRIGGTYFDLNPDPYTSQTTVYLQFARTGNTFVASFSNDGTDWQDVYTVSYPAANTLYVGPSLLNEWQNNPIWADFDYFELIDLGSTYAPGIYGYQFANGGTDAADWDTFRDTFGAANVDGNPFAWVFYQTEYKCVPGFRMYGCKEVFRDALCNGMANSSALFYYGWIDPPDFLESQGVQYPVQLPSPTQGPDGLWEADPVVDLLIRYHGYQFGTQYIALDAQYNLSVAETLDTIIDAIDAGSTNPFGIALWNPYRGKCPGHALFPYRYEVNGANTAVYVYDPNHPKDAGCPETGCCVVFDTEADTWSYVSELGTWTSTAWQNAAECNGFTGLKAMPLWLYAQRPSPPFLTLTLRDSALADDEFYYQLSVGDFATLLIEDDAGNRTGYQDGVFYDEIAGAIQVHPIGVTPGITPDYPEKYQLPIGLDLTVHLQHESSGEVGLLSMAPGRFIAVSGNALTSGAEDLVHIDGDWLGLSFDVGEDTTDSALAITAGDAALAYTHAVERSDLTSGSQARFSAPTDNHISYQVLGSSSAYDAVMELAGSMTRQFRATCITIADGDKHYLTIDWAVPETALLEIDEDSDGDIDATIVLKNETNRVYLPLVLRGFP